MIYHLAAEADWNSQKNSSEYRHPSLVEENFIHCSTREQLVKVANLFFLGKTDLLVLSIDPDKLKSDLKYDPVEEFGEDFPHIYGPINVDAVTQVVPFPPNESGEFSWPALLDRDAVVRL